MMPTIDVKDLDNKKVGSLELPEELFRYPYKRHLIHEAVRNYRAGLRAGTHKTKVRSEVSGSGKKPFRQKGTGRARQGGSRPPIHRHGGTIFGPMPRDYSYKMNVREKKNALKAALSRKLRDEQIMVVSSFELEAPKTKALVARIGAMGIEGKALLVDSVENLNLQLASRNHPRLHAVDPLMVNVYDVVNSRFVVFTEASLRKLMEVLQR
jgi:large subunit ribosomal protein L4